MNHMNKDLKFLQTIAFMFLMADVLLILLAELDIIAVGRFADATQNEFIVHIIMTLVTLVALPICLRLMHMKRIRERLSKENTPTYYNRLSLLRVSLLGVILLINTICYYLFMKVTFLYLAIIVMLAYILIFPTKNRYGYENTKDE